jgi:hypothetical protein
MNITLRKRSEALFIVYFMVCWCASGWAQQPAERRYDEPYAVTVKTPKSPTNNELFVGVDNLLEIEAQGVPDGALVARLTPAGMVEPVGGNAYLAKVREPGRAYLEVYYKGSLIGKKTYFVKRLQDPVEH